MTQTTYQRPTPAQEPALLDFCNMVFSMAHVPHDFSKLIPKVYGQPGFGQHHLVAMEDGRIAATVAVLPLSLQVPGQQNLHVGYVGTVSSHPHLRGHGHMKELMRLAEEDARARGMDLMVLGGQRQRYNYFGFEQAMTGLTFLVTSSNVRHGLGDVDDSAISLVPMSELSGDAVDTLWRLDQARPFTAVRSRKDYSTILATWQVKVLAVLDKGQPIGTVTMDEDTLHDLALPADRVMPVIKRLMAQQGLSRLSVLVPGHQTEMISALQTLAEKTLISTQAMIRVLNWQRTLQCALGFAAQKRSLTPGEALLHIAEEGVFRLSVDGHGARVERLEQAPSDAPAAINPLSAISLLFSPVSLLAGGTKGFHDWLPLPLSVAHPDAF